MDMKEMIDIVKQAYGQQELQIYMQSHWQVIFLAGLGVVTALLRSLWLRPSSGLCFGTTRPRRCCIQSAADLRDTHASLTSTDVFS